MSDLNSLQHDNFAQTHRNEEGSCQVMARGRPSRQTIYNRLDEAIEDLRTRMGGLPSPAEAEAIWEELWHQEAHHSTALEGNTLVLNEVRKLLDEGRAVGSKELREYMEVVGYGAAAKWVYGQALEPGDWTTGVLNILEVRTVHYEAMTPVWNVVPHAHAARPRCPAIGVGTTSSLSPKG
jgi:hypothetical protein